MGGSVLIGVSLKMYFGYGQTLQWCQQVASIAAAHPAVNSHQAEVFVMPTFPALAPALEIFGGGPVAVGAQDLFWEPSGAFTGEVGAPFLVEMGCRYVEIGHAERRRIFGENLETIAAKTAAALAGGLTPVICLGEEERLDPSVAATQCLTELTEILRGRTDAARVVIAYEPVWAIGAPEPAAADYISAVCRMISAGLGTAGAAVTSSVIYGGSAKPGLLSSLGNDVGGLFLGRFAHDPAALELILDEVIR